MVSFLMELLSYRSFKLRTSDDQISQLRRICNGVPQGSTLTPMLFNIYTSATSWKQHRLSMVTQMNWHYSLPKGLEGSELTMNYDMQSLSDYLKRWQLKLSSQDHDIGISPQQQRRSSTTCNLCEWSAPTKF